MNRLQTELRRLFAPSTAAEPAVVDADGRARCAVLGFVAPADAALVGAVWSGVQEAFGLPAPAIAVSGDDALQLWFVFREPVDAARAQALLDAIRRRWLAALPPRRLRAWPAADAAVPALPGRPVADDRWSAFVAPDLAPLFAETPWLEFAPGDDAQATLAAGIEPIAPAALAAALAPLAPEAAAPAPEDRAAAGGVAPRLADAPRDPQGFLLAVMNDERVPLALRVDAAKALLAHAAAVR